jgi:hypothetical protein
MTAGEAIVFSGFFLPDEEDCIKERSLTQQGSMTEPEFGFRFTRVRPALGS